MKHRRVSGSGQFGFLPDATQTAVFGRPDQLHAHPDSHPCASRGSPGTDRDQRVEGADGAAVLPL